MRVTIDFDSKRTRRAIHVFAAGLLACAVAFPVYVGASQVGALTSFTAGTPIRAADFNSNFLALSGAINDTDSKLTTLTTKVNSIPAGPQGPTGPTGPAGLQGPAGPTQIILAGASIAGTGGGTNAWTANTLIGSAGGIGLATSQVSGKPYTATFRIVTSDATSGAPGTSLVAGNLVLDCVWTYLGGRVGATNAFERPAVTQAAVATVVITAGPNDKTVTFTGTVPVAPTTPNGFPTNSFDSQTGGIPAIRVNAATTAQGQSVGYLTITISP